MTGWVLLIGSIFAAIGWPIMMYFNSSKSRYDDKGHLIKDQRLEDEPSSDMVEAFKEAIKKRRVK